jgi:Protein of unknown function (DUF3078)
MEVNLKKLILCLLILVFTAGLSAEPWEKTLDIGLNLTQNTYSDSWTGGEAGNLTWVAKADGIFQKQMSPKFNFRSTLKFAFGQTHSQDKDSKDWDKPEKSTDKIDIENLGRFTLDAFIDPYIALRFESQFVDASVASSKRYINPMLWTESVGASKVLYTNEKNELLSRLGFAVKQTLTSVIIDTTRDARDWETQIDGGFESVTDIKYAFTETLNYVGKLSLYKAFFFSDKDELEGTPHEDYWQAVDVNFENTFSAAVAKYINVSLYVQVLYDKQIDKRGRLKQTLALGLTYKMF